MPNELEYIILKKINDKGALTLGEFINLALCHEVYGYYSNSDPFGLQGDFITAPEISQMFGEVIGAWIADIWIKMGKPQIFNIVECGAGRGTLMADIMRSCKGVSGFGNAIQIHFIENSAVLRTQQKQAMKGYKPLWYNHISDVNLNDPCLILGNEFLDALPVEQLRFGKDGCWQQKKLNVKNGTNLLEFTWEDADKKLINLLPKKTQSEQIYEVSPARLNFISDCCDILKSLRGVALFIDYGHDKSHYGDTLQALKRHKFCDVLHDIGNCDITTHVDFDALSRQVMAQNLNIEPIITQGEFLKSLGIELRAAKLKKIGGSKQNIDNDLNRLTGREQMGELFKVMCFYNY